MCLDAFAENVRAGLACAGIISEGAMVELSRDVPDGVLGGLDTSMHWLLPIRRASVALAAGAAARHG